MRFTTIFNIAAALAFGTVDALPKRDGRMGSIEIFQDLACDGPSVISLEVTNSDINKCISFSQNIVTSLQLNQWFLPASEGCSLFIYTADDCSSGRRTLGWGDEGLCVKAPPYEDSTWNSWAWYCPMVNVTAAA
ncbi:hypothetical protein F5Y15DRAFT_418276 [Xylariaceae sp. FL0016]|nr:hypothetical protein F5Y15DRAFT_418276 [Xylariaceae sp. FL0016]